MLDIEYFMIPAAHTSPEVLSPSTTINVLFPNKFRGMDQKTMTGFQHQDKSEFIFSTDKEIKSTL